MPRALVIDDDAFFRQVVADMLEKLGYEPVHAATGTEGMEKFLAREPDIILLDLNLPDVHGFELLEHFAQREMAGRVIVTTSDYSLDTALRSLRTGAGDYLPKPIRQEQLSTSVERIGRNLNIQRENQVLHQQLRKRVQDLKLMRHIAQLANSTRPASEWTNDITTAVCNYIGAEAGSLLLLRDAQTLVFYTAAGPAREKLKQVELPRASGGLAWWCIEHLEPVKIDHPASDGRFNPEIDKQTGFTTRNLLAVPITVGGR
ncbi:MAG: response regulator, partial [Deltaproteobacteria bacterium]